MNKRISPVLLLFTLGFATAELPQNCIFAVKAETGDTHKLAFGEIDHAISYNPNGSQSTSIKATSDGEVLTLSANDTGSYFSNYISLEARTTYLLTGEVMLPESGGGLNITLNGDWSTVTSLYSEDLTAGEYTTFSATYTPDSARTDQIILQVSKTPANGIFKFRHLFVAKQWDVTEGNAIGSIIPSLPANTVDKTYDYWTVDGEQINADTIYSFTGDKLALPHYNKRHSLTFEYQASQTAPNLFLDGDFNSLDGWNVNSAAEMISIQDTTAKEGNALKYEKASSDGTSYFQSKSYSVFSNSTYRLTYFIKVENASNLDFSTFISGEDGYLSWKDYFTESVIDNCDWTKISAEFTVNPGSNLETTAFIGFKFYAGSGTVYLDNAKLELVKNTRYYSAGDTLGTLPALPAKEGYHGSWTIDGEEVNQDTVWKWGGDKTAGVTFAPNKYTLSFAYFDYASNTTGASVSAPGLTYKSEAEKLTLNNTTADTLTYQTPSFRLPAGNQYRIVGNYTGTNASIVVNGTTAELSASPLSFDFATSEETDFSFLISLAGGSQVTFSSFYLLDLRKNKAVTYQSAIGELPSFESTPEGKFAVWRWNGEKLSRDTIYNVTTDGIALLSFENESHQIKFQIGDKIVETREVAYGDPIGAFPTYETRTGYEAKWTIDGTEVNASSSFSYHDDVTAVLTYTPITYTASFEVDGQIIARVPFTVEDEAIQEPAIPAKKGYSAHWEPYTLTASDMIIKAVYEANRYFVTIKSGEYGQVLSTVQISYGQKLGDVISAWPTLPAKDGYQFDHWAMNGNPVTLDTVFDCEDDVEIYAVYQKIEVPSSSENSSENPSSVTGDNHEKQNGPSFGAGIGVGVAIGIVAATIGFGIYLWIESKKDKTK